MDSETKKAQQELIDALFLSSKSKNMILEEMQVSAQEIPAVQRNFTKLFTGYLKSEESDYFDERKEVTETFESVMRLLEMLK